MHRTCQPAALHAEPRGTRRSWATSERIACSAGALQSRTGIWNAVIGPPSSPPCPPATWISHRPIIPQDTATYWQDSLLCFQTCRTLEAHLWVFLNLGVFCSTPWEQLNMGTGDGEWGDNRLIPVAQGTTCTNSTHQVRQLTNLCCRGREKLPKNKKIECFVVAIFSF